MRELLFLLVVLACPLAMLVMMRGGHGHGGHRHTTASPRGRDERSLSAEELRRRRRELDRLIEDRERADVHVSSEGTPLFPANDRKTEANAR